MGALRSNHTPITLIFLDAIRPTVRSRTQKTDDPKRAHSAHSGRTRSRARHVFHYLAHVNVLGKEYAICVFWLSQELLDEKAPHDCTTRIKRWETRQFSRDACSVQPRSSRFVGVPRVSQRGHQGVKRTSNLLVPFA